MGLTIWQEHDSPHVAVVGQFAVDHLTPIGAFEKLRPWGAHTLLESVEGDQKVARFSFVGVGQWARLQDIDGQAVLSGTNGVVRAEDPMDLIRQQNAAVRVGVPDSVELPFVGGAIGYFSFDWVRRLERLPRRHTPRGPRWEWVWPQTVIAFDHYRRQVTIIVEAQRGHEQEASGQLHELVQVLRRPHVVEPPAVKRLTPVVSNCGSDLFEEMVGRARAHIFAGDIFQVVLSQRLSTQISGDPWHLYRRLRHLNPSPYLFFLETAAKTLVGASPEALIRVFGDTVESRPIAGTRPRGSNPDMDQALWAELLADPKERAEHTMLVDLARNDVGRVSAYGTVAVTQLMVRESYSHVMHIVSEVQGRLAPGFDALDALAASFPAGTLSGAPKIRAMEIIEELEPESRGAYGGVVGYLSHRGDLDACITIRTIEVEGTTASIQAGGGIVADSVPAREYQESLSKAGAALQALEGGGEWL